MTTATPLAGTSQAATATTERPTRSSDSPATVPKRASVAAVADNVVDVMRTFSKARARILAAAAHDVEWSAHTVLKLVQHEGPLRAGAVADYLRSDPSTVSRQVALLVKDGLLERQADPQDGRASLLVVTPAGEGVLAEHDRIRVDYFAHMLEDWDVDELDDFAAKLARFGAAYTAATDDDWLSQRMAEQARNTMTRSTT